MNAEIEMLSQVLGITLGVFILVVCGVLVYVCWLWLELHREVRRGCIARRPEVERDHTGKRIKERV